MEDTNWQNDDILSFHPGPKKSTILHLQDKHRSSVIWDVGGGDTQRSRRRNPNRNRYPSLHPRMIPILTDMRFDGVARLATIDIDWSLITALIERWRPETHTFHLPTGECTITLQDVSVLLGLRIDGDAVIGRTEFEGGWDSLVENVFGIRPAKNQLKGGRLQLSWLTSSFPSLPDDASDDQLVIYTKSYMLQLIGGILLTDHSGSQVHCMYIQLIQDIDHCKTLSWGSAVLGFLFRELCKSSKIGAEENAGCILLLQLWAWTRLPSLAPICRGPMNNLEIWGDIRGPLGVRWCAHLSFQDTSSHVVSAYRLALDVLSPSQFIWQPYSDDILSAIHEYCREDAIYGCYKGPLICFHIVEPHNSNRCMRQFGMIQDIPSLDEYSSDLHNIDLKGKTDINWLVKHHDHIFHWNNRQQHMVVSNVGMDVVDGYNEWYNEVTRRYHTRVGGTRSYMLDLLNCISMIARGEIIGDIAAIASKGKDVIEDQFRRGAFQDFPVDDRRAKEKLLNVKTKKKGHKGGRGGVNAPSKNKLHDDEISYKGGGNMIDEGMNSEFEERANILDKGTSHLVEDANHAKTSDFSDLYVDELLGHINDPEAVLHNEKTTDIDLTPPLSHPTFNLLSSSDSVMFESFDPVVQPSVGKDKELTKETETEVDHSPPLSQPTFNLLTQSPEPPVQEHMKLRPRKYEGQKCGTGGHKIIQPYKRLRLKKA